MIEFVYIVGVSFMIFPKKQTYKVIGFLIFTLAIFLENWVLKC